MYIIYCPDKQKNNKIKGKQICQNQKIKLVAVKTVLACATAKIKKKSTNQRVATNNRPARLGGFSMINFMLARIG